MLSNKEITKQYFTYIEDDVWRCICGRNHKQDVERGYGNLMEHIRTDHPDYKTKSQTVIPINKRSENRFSWLEWTIMKGFRSISNKISLIGSILICNPFAVILKISIKKVGIKKTTRVTMLEARILFDSLLERFPGLDYISCGISGEPVMTRDSEFELGVCKALEGNMMKLNEKADLVFFKKRFVSLRMIRHISFADAVLAKRTKCETFDLKWIPPTSNKEERPFSRVRHIFTDYRKSLSPINLESQIFLNVNKKHWNVFTVQELFLRMKNNNCQCKAIIVNIKQ